MRRALAVALTCLAATHAGRPENTDPDAPPYGVHLRLRPGVDVSAFTGPQRVVLTALQKWADLGIEAQSFGALTVDDFEVIDHGPEVPVTYERARIGD